MFLMQFIPDTIHKSMKTILTGISIRNTTYRVTCRRMPNLNQMLTEFVTIQVCETNISC